MGPLDQKNEKKKPQKPILKKNKPVFSGNFADFNPETGEKVADAQQQGALAKMEALGEAKKTRRSASNKEETLKDAATGGSLSFLVSNSAVAKDSTRFKALTALRKKGLIGVGGAIGAGVLSQRKQKSEYNRQQASRELFAGKKTGRSEAYKSYLNGKYNKDK